MIWVYQEANNCPVSFSSSLLSSFHFITMFMIHVKRLRLVHRVVELEIERNCRKWSCFVLAAGKIQHYTCRQEDMSHLLAKPTKWHVRSAKTQISQGIHPVWSESSLCAQWVAKDPSFLHADSEDLIRLGRIPGWSESLLGAHAILLVLSRGGSYWAKRRQSRRPLIGQYEHLTDVTMASIIVGKHSAFEVTPW